MRIEAAETTLDKYMELKSIACIGSSEEKK